MASSLYTGAYQIRCDQLIMNLSLQDPQALYYHCRTTGGAGGHNTSLPKRAPYCRSKHTHTTHDYQHECVRYTHTHTHTHTRTHTHTHTHTHRPDKHSTCTDTHTH